MSWVEKIKSKMQITTGDGKLYDVLYKLDTVKGSYDFNISEFHFPEVDGTKVDRRLRKGKRYPLEFYFQGENHIDQWNEFDASCSDVRPWEVLHPIYGLIVCQPISIAFDSSSIGITKVDVTVVESLTNAGPKTVLRPGENARSIVTLSRANNETFFNSQITPSVSDVTLMKSNVDSMYTQASSVVTDNTISANYYNAFQKAYQSINTSMSVAGNAITLVNDFINHPAQFSLSVKERISIFASQLAILYAKLENITTPNEKKIFEQQAGSIINGIIDTAVTPQSGDYSNSVDVIYVIELVINYYNGFIENLQTLQTVNGFESDSYLPDATFIDSLNYAVNYAVSNLYEIALNARQERIICLEEDSNIIILAHRFYGLSEDDSTIDYFAQTNNIGLSETFQVEKGRKIVYYV